MASRKATNSTERSSITDDERQLMRLELRVMEGYGIDPSEPDAWQRLSRVLHLALRELYALSAPDDPYTALERKKGGAPRRWDEAANRLLYISVRMRPEGKSIGEACMELTRKPFFRRFGGPQTTPSQATLQRRYHLLAVDRAFVQRVNDDLRHPPQQSHDS